MVTLPDGAARRSPPEAGRARARGAVRRRVPAGDRQAARHRGAPDLQARVGDAAERGAVAGARPGRRRGPACSRASTRTPRAWCWWRCRRRACRPCSATRHAGRMRKEYLAVVQGLPAGGGIDPGPLGRDPGDRRRVVARADGAPSETRYEVTVEHRRASVVRCELVTGRTHQIRVHLASRAGPSSATDLRHARAA